ncbi:hypothetical protein [Leucobacter sp. 1207-22]|uniref:hypothetical protein n=1 Tax=Leucobacter sp. 1207-22 TaxID=2604456 RepID=UPI00406445E1
MTHERQPPHVPPEQRTVCPAPEPTPQPRTRAEARELERLRLEYGAAFEVYLERIWNGVEPIPDMENDFTNLHWASYDRIEHFIDDQLDALG